MVFQQSYLHIDDRGQEVSRNQTFRAKIPADEAAKFDLQPGGKMTVRMPGFDSVGDGAGEGFQTGEATLRDRDYGAPA